MNAPEIQVSASQSAEQSEAVDKARRNAQLEALLATAKQRTQRLRALASGLAVLIAIVAALAVWAIGQRDDAQRQTRQATSLALASSANAVPGSRLDLSLLLAW